MDNLTKWEMSNARAPRPAEIQMPKATPKRALEIWLELISEAFEMAKLVRDVSEVTEHLEKIRDKIIVSNTISPSQERYIIEAREVIKHAAPFQRQQKNIVGYGD